jgi:flagellar FliJ protein
MIPYRFRLAVLLKLRVQERDQRRMEYGQALEAERILALRRDELLAERRTTDEASRQAKSPGAANVDALQQLQRYVLLLQGQLAALNKQIEQVAAEVQRRREALVEADRQVKTLEKLRDKQLAAHEHKALALEGKELDELAIGGYVAATGNKEPLR